MVAKVKAKYRNGNGDVCPGVTTIVRELGWNTNTLVRWANKLGLQGIDSTKYVDDKASIGTLAHGLILADLSGGVFDKSNYTPNQISQAENCLLSYYEWRKKRKLVPVFTERMLVHEELNYGGTPDYYGEVDGVLSLIDYKTGKGIYAEYFIQVAAYVELIKNAGHKVDDVRILSIPRSEDESFTEKIITPKQIDAGFKIFRHLRAIYDLKSVIKKED